MSNTEIANAARVMAWARDPKRKSPQVAFTDGPERQAAYWIEWAEMECGRTVYTPPDVAPDGERTRGR